VETDSILAEVAAVCDLEKVTEVWLVLGACPDFFAYGLNSGFFIVSLFGEVCVMPWRR
jgi:hypothetical protein